MIRKLGLAVLYVSIYLFLPTRIMAEPNAMDILKSWQQLAMDDPVTARLSAQKSLAEQKPDSSRWQ